MVINAGKKDVIWNYLGIFISFGSKGRTVYIRYILDSNHCHRKTAWPFL